MFEPDKKFEQEIDVWIEAHEQDFVKDIARLVAIPSISEEGKDAYPYGKECARVLDEASAICSDYGFTVRNHAGRCASLLEKGTDEMGKRIGLFSHLDVVPLGDGWMYPPLVCTQKDGYLIGRGVGDNKGPAMCAVYALRFLKEHRIRLRHDVLIYFGCAEETGMDDLEYFVKEHADEIPDLCLVADTNFPVCYGEKGLFRADLSRTVSGNLESFTAGEVVNVIPGKAEAVISGISVTEVREKLGQASGITVTEVEGGWTRLEAVGVSRHAAFPEGSVNAIHVLSTALTEAGLLAGTAADAVAAVAELTSDAYGHTTGIPFEDSESGKLTSVGSVIRLEGGTLTLSFDVRYPVTVTGEDVRDRFETCAVEHGFDVTVKELDAPAYVPLDRPYIPLLAEICNHVHGKQYEPYTMGGGTYSRKLPNGIGFGPGIPDMKIPFPAGHGSGHQPDECIALDVLLKGLKIYILALMELDASDQLF